jgi:hypothetical protein
LKDTPALRALAIRERKTYVVDLPKVPINNAVLYVDVEGMMRREAPYRLTNEARAILVTTL